MVRHNLKNEGSRTSAGTKVRKYSDKYLQLGFTYAGSEDGPKPQCVICLETLSSECMKPAKLQHHLETKHKEYTCKSLDLKKIKLVECKKSQKVLKTTTGLNINEIASFASYEVSQLVAKAGKAHTIAEELILPIAVALCKRMLGDAAAKLVSAVPLSDNTVQRRITDMAGNIENTLFIRLCMCDMFALQLDKSTDVTKKATMLVFVRFIWENQLLEDFLFSCELMHTSAEDIFQAVDGFLNKHHISWENCWHNYRWCHSHVWM